MAHATTNAFALASLTLLLTACATPPDSQADEAHEQKVYRTGSNLPVRDPSAASRTQSGDRDSVQLPPLGMPNRPGG